MRLKIHLLNFLKLLIQPQRLPEYKNNLMKKQANQYVKVSADRAVMPDYKWVFNTHAQFMQNAFGKINSPEAFEKAVNKAKEYNEKHGEVLCAVEQVDGETIVAVCDMLTRRVHKLLPQSGDIVYEIFFK